MSLVNEDDQLHLSDEPVIVSSLLLDILIVTFYEYIYLVIQDQINMFTCYLFKFNNFNKTLFIKLQFCLYLMMTWRTQEKF